MQFVFKYVWVISFSYVRLGVFKIVVVIIDGKLNSKFKILDEVEKLCNSSVIIFFVGVGFGVDRIEFEGMVFKVIYVFDVVMFNVLEFIRE